MFLNGKRWIPAGLTKSAPQKPTINQSVSELMKPLGEKTWKGNVWGSVIVNVEKDGEPTPQPTPTPSPTSVTPTPTPTSTPTPTPSVPSFDPDAQAFITAAGITSSTEQNALNTMVVSLKGSSLWSKMQAVYPFIGGTSTSMKYNLMNPVDSDAAFRLTFYGGMSYSSSGATGNGTNAYADTHYSNYDTTQDDYSFGFYQFTENTPVVNEELLIGNFVNAPCFTIATNFGPGSHYFRSGDQNVGSLQANSDNIDGFYIGNRSGSTTSELYRNGNLTPLITINSSYSGYGGVLRNNYLWNMNVSNAGYSNGYANQGLSFAFFGKKLTSSDITNFTNIVNTFNTTLNRNTF